MSTRSDYQFGDFLSVRIRSNISRDLLPAFRPFKVQPARDAPTGPAAASPWKKASTPTVAYGVVLRSAAPHLLFRHPIPGREEADHGQRFITEEVEELRTALEWDVYRVIRSYLDPFYLIHAGAVARGGVGWVLYAPSGGGKSTLAAGLLSRGFQYLSDEIAVLDPHSRSILPFPKALSFEEEPRHLRLPPGPEIEGITYQMGEKRWRSWQIDPGAIGPALPPVGSSFPPRFLVKVAYDPQGKSRLTRMSKAHTVMELIKSSFNFDRHRGQGVDLLAHLAEECECLSLSMSCLEDAVDDILRMSN